MKRIWIYIGTTFVCSWFIMYAMMAGDGLESRWANVLVMLVTAMPALGNALTRIATGEGFKGNTGVSGMYLRPTNTGRGTAKYYVGAWLLPIAATLVGAALYFLTNPALFDPHMDHYASMLRDAYAAIGQEYADAELHRALHSEVLIRMTFYPCLNLIMCLASELGWRGYLMPHLTEKYSDTASVLISGVIWGLWYSPMIEMGQYYGTGYAGYPFVGMIAAILMCMVLGCFFSYLTMQTGSVIASAVASAVFQSICSVPLYFCASEDYNTLIGPSPVGLIGGIGFILIGGWCMLQMIRNKKQ